MSTRIQRFEGDEKSDKINYHRGQIHRESYQAS